MVSMLGASKRYIHNTLFPHLNVPPVQYEYKDHCRPRWPKVPDWCVPDKPEWGDEVSTAPG